MTVRTLDIAEPFFTVKVVGERPGYPTGNPISYPIGGKTIVLNLAEEPLSIRQQSLSQLQSVIAVNTTLEQVRHAVMVERFADHENDQALMARIRDTWPSAFDVRQEERLRGIQHYMSPKTWIGQYGFTFYHSASVPLNVGLHREHAFCPVPGYREVHTQIVGFGKMQQCREQDTETLYIEEPMAPGHTHRPMYDEAGNYPWHQFETITPSVFMAVEILPDGAVPP